MSSSYVLGACPLCATTDAAVVTDRDGGRAELEELWEQLAGADVEPLPLARLADTVSFTQPPPLALVRCHGCGLLYRNPRERDVEELYETEPTDAARLAELAAAQLPVFSDLVRRLTARSGGPGRGLELGSYSGAFLDAAAAAGWRFRGTDVNPRTIHFLRERGHEVCAGGIEECAPDGALDVVACWNCFEQLPDPLGTARTAWERLRPGGLLGLRVPNGGFYLALRPRLHGPFGATARALLARHNFLGFPYRHGFTRATLRRLLAMAGFSSVAIGTARVLPAGADPRWRGRGLDVLERGLRPVTGPPWLEVFARR